MAIAQFLILPNRDQLIFDHLPQVHLLARRLHARCPREVELDDLVSAGTVGLLQAINRFDPARECKLKTLAEHRIRGAMLDYLRQLDPLSRAVRKFVRDRDAAQVRLAAELGRSPIDEEIAEAVGVSVMRYRRLQVTVRAAKVVSIELAARAV